MKITLPLLLAGVLMAACAHAQTVSCANYAQVTSQPALYFPERGEFFLYDGDDSKYVQVANFGPKDPSLQGITGDWNKSGFDGIGYYDPATAVFALKYKASSGPADLTFTYGQIQPGNIKPVAGDWTGKGYKSIGIFDGNGKFWLKNTNTGGNADIILSMTNIAGALPVTGDWVGDGITRVGLYNPANNTFYLRMTNDPANNATTAVTLSTGNGWWAGAKPAIGKWTTGMKTDGLGLQSNNSIMERNGMTNAPYDTKRDLAPVGNMNVQILTGKWKPSHCLAAGQNTTPDPAPWMKDMILYNLRIETFTGGSAPGTFNSAAAKLPFLADLGVTGIILTPIASLNSTLPDYRPQIFYGPSLPDLIDPRLGSEEDFKNFVKQAHDNNIKVFVDNVVHGIHPSSPYVSGPVDGIDYSKNPFHLDSRALPGDFFTHLSNGLIKRTWWGTAQWDWSSPALWDWWSSHIGVAWVQKYDIDGFRLDLEPNIGGTQLWDKIRADVLEIAGKQIALIPEITLAGRGYTFDLSQTSDIGPGRTLDIYNGDANIVDVVKSLPEQFYTYFLADRDGSDYAAKGRLSVFGYGAILGPFVPHWFAGDEFNAGKNLYSCAWCTNLYFNVLNWNDQTANASFTDQVKKLIQIRKDYKNILAPLDRPLKQTNIVKVTGYSGTDLPPYTMWDGTTSITVLAKRATAAGSVNVKIPVDAIGLGSYNYFNVTDLWNGSVSLHPRSDAVSTGLNFNVAQYGVDPIKLTPVPTDSEIKGFIDTVQPDGKGAYNIKGWACSSGVEIPVAVHLYVGNNHDQFGGGATANQSSEAGVAKACGNTGKNYRFTLPLPATAVTSFGGQSFFIHGISPIGKANLTITNAKGLLIPVSPTCGNNTRESPEQCDNGTANGRPCTADPGSTCQYCSNACTLQTVTRPPVLCPSSYQVTFKSSWNSLLAGNALWATPGTASAPALTNLTVTFSKNITTAGAGTYTVSMAADNSATLSIDGAAVCASTSYSTTAACSVNLSKGGHTVTLTGVNADNNTNYWTGNPAGVAMTLTDAAGTMVLSTNPAAAWTSTVTCPPGTKWDCAALNCR